MTAQNSEQNQKQQDGQQNQKPGQQSQTPGQDNATQADQKKQNQAGAQKDAI